MRFLSSQFAVRHGQRLLNFRGLQYLGEADFPDMQDMAETPEVRSTLRKLARDPIEKEQYMDFLKCRRFRQTLLCHAEQRLSHYRSVLNNAERHWAEKTAGPELCRETCQ